MIIKKQLRELSFDNANRIIVCDYKNEFIDFDTSKGALQREQTPNTPDMLYIDDEKKEIWFVEFKSSSKNSLDREKFKLKRKILSGLILFYELFCQDSCKYKDYDKYYFVVYNKPQEMSYEDELLSIFDENSYRSIEFDLEELKPKFLKEVFTENCNALRELFLRRFGINFER